jgi:hypothetical protein
LGADDEGQKALGMTSFGAQAAREGQKGCIPMPRYGRRRFDEADDFSVDERDAARRRVRARRELSSRIVGFIVMSGVLVVIWAIGGGGYFWPGWIIGIIGALLVLQVWRRLGRRPLTEEDVDAEMRRHRDR